MPGKCGSAMSFAAIWRCCCEKRHEPESKKQESGQRQKPPRLGHPAKLYTRPRDFYDTYILLTTQRYDKAVFQEALRAAAEHRGTASQTEDVDGILKNINESAGLKAMWEKYRRQLAYAKGIEFADIIDTLRRATAYQSIFHLSICNPFIGRLANEFLCEIAFHTKDGTITGGEEKK